MKRIVLWMLLFAVIVTFAGCGMWETHKNDIFTLVEENYDNIISACENGDKDALLAIEGISEVYVRGDYVFVYCKGAGIAPSSQDYGFYYSRENLPVAVSDGQILCRTEDLQPEGNGYQYTDDTYNVFYTEHITGKCYFYSASF